MAERRSARPQMGEAAWSERIREALQRDRLTLHAQRIVDVGSGETVRHELFLRMVEEEGLIPAGEFVVAAEEQGSIREIDRWVAGKAIEIAAAGCPVHLNLSVRSIDGDLLALILERLEATGANPADLVFELGEAQLAAAGEDGADFVRALSDAGCGLALDHYEDGGGKADLLRRYPLDYVKLSPNMAGDLVSDEKRRALRSVLLTAHGCGQKVIAQGVESLVVLQALEGLGVDEAQGYVLGAPEPVESLLGDPV